MEERLKKQRNTLFLRVTLTLLAVWLLVSAAYCAICLHSEKTRVQNEVLEDLSAAKQRIPQMSVSKDITGGFLYVVSDMIYADNGKDRDWNTQLVVLNGKTGDEFMNTASCLLLRFDILIKKEINISGLGFVDCAALRARLTDEQLETIKTELTRERGDSSHCELICTKFYTSEYEVEFIPAQLVLAVVKDENEWFVSDEIIATFDLDTPGFSEQDLYVCNDMHRNTIPPEAIFGSESGEFIGELTPEQLEKPSGAFKQSAFEYIVYASDSVFLPSDTEPDSGVIYVIRYAKLADLLKNCRFRLGAGISVSFAFFFVIAVILCVMVWKMVRAQIISEQQRLDLTNALAHDIKTPIFVISGYAYSMKEGIGEDERDTYLDRIIEQTDAINALVHKMLNLSRLTSGATTLNLSSFDVSELIRGICGSYASLPEGKRLVLSADEELTVSADRELLKTAFGNLIENALKYSPKGSAVTVSVSGSAVTIANECEPLTKAELRQIWQPYVRRDKSRKNGSGNGLGLSIVHSVFKLHGISCTMEMEGTQLVCTVKF